ncbi:MAG: hypothetical protein C4306_00225 [Thermoleophilia bacterium]
MPFWRRREPLHERLAREGGPLESERPPHDTMPRWGEPGIHGVPRPRQWDATALVEAAGTWRDEGMFVALADGRLLCEQGEGVPVEALAAALDPSIRRPYRAWAVRRGDHVWAVAARRIEVARLVATPGEEIELTVHEGERSLRVDGMPSLGSAPELEALAEERGLASYVAQAARLEGDLWEIRLSPL